VKRIRVDVIGVLGRLTDKRRWLVLGVWGLLVAAAVPLAARQTNHLAQNGYFVNGSQSAHVDALLHRQFPRESRAGLAVLLWPKHGASAGALERDIREVQRALRGIDGVSLSSHDVQIALFGTGLVEPVVLPLNVSASEAAAQRIALELRSRLDVGGSTRDRVEIHLLGVGAYWAGIDAASKQQLASAETIGFPFLLVVLLLIFGALWAASLPVALGLIAVLVSGAMIFLLSLVMQLSVFVTNAASLVGIGVAVDYSLIVLARVRQELAAGHDFETARRRALETSGRVVIVSGLAVTSSLSGLWLINDNTVRSLALGAVLVVAVSVLAAVTLLPALISVIGPRRLAGGALARFAARRRAVRRRPSVAGWERWTSLVTGHPLRAIAVAGGVMLLLCVPALRMRTATGALEQFSAGNETLVGFQEARSLEGPGALGPVNVVAAATPTSHPRLPRTVARLRALTESLPDVHSLGATRFSSAGSYAFFTIFTRGDPEAPAATTLVERLRERFVRASAGSGVRVFVGGTPASLLDIEQEFAGSIWKVIVAVLVLAFIVLTVLLRSLLLPLKAIVLNLLSVGAAYGVLVAVFQWGWFNGLLGFRAPGHIETITPVVILALAFGLSMDYEVFLLSRIKERWLAGAAPRAAVAEGLAASAQTISSAALILVCAFGVFVVTGLPSIKQIGVGAAAAIALDATLIRLVLVPATMELLGKWNWWLPSGLMRILPTAAPAPADTPPASAAAEPALR
jgi:RND superfamily putative drug exporter